MQRFLKHFKTSLNVFHFLCFKVFFVLICTNVFTPPTPESIVQRVKNTWQAWHKLRLAVTDYGVLCFQIIHLFHLFIHENATWA